MNSHYIGINALKGLETSYHQPFEFHIDVTALIRTEASMRGIKGLRWLWQNWHYVLLTLIYFLV